MVINSYSFGRIVIDDKEYSSDLKIIKQKVIPNWWRKEGHFLSLSDIPEIKEANPKILLVGTGSPGLMKVSDEVKNYCKKNGIELIELNSKKASDKFNEIKNKKDVMVLFHLTC